MSSFESVGARLAVEHATVTAVGLLKRNGIDCIVLRGPWLARRLYGTNEPRASIDVDLLVEDISAGSKVLELEGYSRMVDWTPGMTRHAWTHVKSEAVSVDLHRTLVGVEAPVPKTWTVLLRESEALELEATCIRVPVLSAQLLIVALHAAQHGSESQKTMEDIRRAIDRYDRSTWVRTAEIARELKAEQALGVGLSLVSRGRELASGLDLETPVSRTTLLRSSTARPAALGFDRLAQLRGRERMTFLIGKAFPPPAFMRDWHPLARRGRTGLALAYGYRLGRLALLAPEGFMSFRAASRKTKAEASANRK